MVIGWRASAPVVYRTFTCGFSEYSPGHLAFRRDCTGSEKSSLVRRATSLPAPGRAPSFSGPVAHRRGRAGALRACPVRPLQREDERAEDPERDAVDAERSQGVALE